MSKRGLPTHFKLRHDAHYVDNLTSKTIGAPIGKMIPIEKLAPNPGQPRSEFGDLSELTESIREHGVLEPLLVRPSDVGGRYMIIAGERRYRASLEVGLAELPCIELNVDERAVAEISLIENLQRKDLSPFEEADGFFALAERFGYKHEDIAKRIGKSRTSVTEVMALAAMPEPVRELCRRADITAKSMLLQIVRMPSEEEMAAFVGRIRESGLTRDQVRAARKPKGKAGKTAAGKGQVFRYAPRESGFAVVVSFKKHKVDKSELETALAETLDHFKAGS